MLSKFLGEYLCAYMNYENYRDSKADKPQKDIQICTSFMMDDQSLNNFQVPLLGKSCFLRLES